MESRRKRLVLLVFVLLVLLGIVVGALFYVNSLYLDFAGERILRSSEVADLRHLQVTPTQYEELSRELPQCHILWKIPIGGQYYDCTDTEIIVETLNREEFPLFRYFDDLQRVNAAEATCYAELLALQEALPNCTVDWAVHMGDKAFSPKTDKLVLDGCGANAAELQEKLALFPNLQSVEITDVLLTAEEKNTLLEAYPGISFIWIVEVSGKQVMNTVQSISFAGEIVDVSSLVGAAPFLPEVKSLDLRGSNCSVEALLTIQSAYEAEVSAEISLYGVDFDTEVTELYFNDIPMASTEQVEQVLPLLPNLTKVEMCNCGISSEEMDALWKRHPEVRFIWAVKIGRVTLRTDITSFIGAKYGYLADAKIADPWKDKYNRLFDEDCVEFKYCVDMVCLDLGHMGITDYSFISYMPKLRYLILADTHGTDFTPLEGLQELVFLELFLTKFNQPEVLLTLPKLEDLNIAFTMVDDPHYLMQMTWLKRLWTSYAKMTFSEYAQLEAALPDTQVDYTAEHSTANGWRTGYLYYEMRDYLGMYYLD